MLAAKVLALLMAIAVTVFPAISTGETQRSRGAPFPGIDHTGEVPEWLPGVWQTTTYVMIDETSVGFPPDHRLEYAVEAEEGEVRVERWREIFPRVEAVFHQNRSLVIRDESDGVTREFTINLEPVEDAGTQPVLRGVLRVDDPSGSVPAYLPILFRKLPNDFYQGPL